MAILSMGGQAWFFLVSCGVGFACGAIYDVLRVFRRLRRHGSIAIAVEDVAFWAVAAGVTFYSVYTLESGRVRLFAIVGVLLGMALYFAVASTVRAQIYTRLRKRRTKRARAD